MIDEYKDTLFTWRYLPQAVSMSGKDSMGTGTVETGVGCKGLLSCVGGIPVLFRAGVAAAGVSGKTLVCAGS